MSVTDILLQHPLNDVINVHDHSNTNQSWAEKYEGITAKELRIYTHDNGPDWSPLIPELSDDMIRRSEASIWSNARSCWVLGNEDDGAAYFRAEILAPVLSKFQKFPAIYERSFPETNGRKKIDCALMWGGYAAAICKFKRNLIDTRIWYDGILEKKSSELRLSRELRGYAIQYECPQVICFDIHCLMLLQFRAAKLEDLRDCAVDCWIFRRCEGNSSGYPLRNAVYGFLVQGIRRLQSLNRPLPRIGSQQAAARAFFSGEPLWRGEDGKMYRQHPEGFDRDTNNTGQLCWTQNGQWVFDNEGLMIPDSIGFVEMV